MIKHQLHKTDDGWQCQVCRQQWKGKPRRECPGVVVYGVKTFVGVPNHLRTELDLASQNLKPVGQPCGCVLDSDRITWLYNQTKTEQLYPYPILKSSCDLKTNLELQALNRSIVGVTPRGMHHAGGTWEFLYEVSECKIANPDLPPIYPWRDRPDNLKTAKQLIRFNLYPGSVKPKGCSWGSWDREWIWLYDPTDEGFEILDPTLPYCYHHKSEVPPDLKSKGELPLFNLKLLPGRTPRACYRIWEQYNKREGDWETVELYHRDDCEIEDPSLPLCYDPDSCPTDLKTESCLKQLNLAPGTASPRGCYRQYRHSTGAIQTTLLYHPDDCQWQPKDQWIAKTTLRRTYLLSDRWISRLGSPDLVRENPHHEKWSAMQLYSRQRVERFLAENAEEYAQWLSERDRYVAIFEQNREAIAAGQGLASEARRQARQAELEQRRAELSSEREMWRERSRELEQQRLVQIEADQPRREQMGRCLKCASGCATGQGFLCVVHPTGLDLDQIPCLDWYPRSS